MKQKKLISLALASILLLSGCSSKTVQKDGKDVGYKNGLFLNQMIALKDKWEIKNIEHRTDELVKTAMKLFSLIDED